MHSLSEKTICTFPETLKTNRASFGLERAPQTKEGDTMTHKEYIERENFIRQGERLRHVAESMLELAEKEQIGNIDAVKVAYQKILTEVRTELK